MYPLSVVFKPRDLPYSSAFMDAEITTPPLKGQTSVALPLGVLMLHVDYRIVDGAWRVKTIINGVESIHGGQISDPNFTKPLYFRVVNDDPQATLEVECRSQTSTAIATARVGVTIIPMDVQPLEITI